MSSGMHGHNGFDPETNLHLVSTVFISFPFIVMRSKVLIAL